MTDNEKQTFDEIMKLLRPIFPPERANIISALKYNGEFCGACGYETPHGSTCHCDE